MKHEVKFCLVFRDMWQSAGKYVPRVDQLVQVAPAIIEMGCFARVETNGGGFEQVNLLFGENPNNAVRAWTQPFQAAGIQTQMLDRALNGLRMSPVPADVRRLFYKVKKVQGTDITRTFCGLNDLRNIKPSIGYAKDAGMISQCALSITCSPVHTVEYYTNMAIELIREGADEICIKDMAGIGRPYSLGQIVANIKKAYPDIPVQYHSHAGPGFSVASILEVCKAGCDYIDVGMEPLSWGTGHADLLTVQAMLKDAGFSVPEINMEAYMEARRLTQCFIDDFLGYFIDLSNKTMTSLLVGCGLPGGMMGSMMADLKGMHNAINLALKQQGKKEVTLNNLVVQLFNEVESIWPMLGCPPLVTPFSQYVKNIALMNIFAAAKDEPRFSMIDKDSWNMILGKTGKLPGPLSPEIIELAKANNLTFYDGNPQDSFPDDLNRFSEEMKANGWEEGPDQEELFEFAMHERQYRDLKSGAAKNRFNLELEKAKEKAGTPIILKRPVVEIPMFSFEEISKEYPSAKPVHAPCRGQLIWQYDLMDASTAPFEGATIEKGDNLCYIQSYYGIEPVNAGYGGTIVGTYARQGQEVQKGEILAFIN